MDDDDGRRAESLGLGRAHEVLAEHVDHARSHQPRIPAGAEDAERERRQDEMREAAVAAHRKPVEMHREDVEEEDADHELRRRGEDEGSDHQSLIDLAAARQRREHAHGHADHDLEEDRAADEEKRRRQARPDQRRDLDLLLIGAAEIALRELARDS